MLEKSGHANQGNNLKGAKMYDTYLFKDNKKLLKWAMEHTCASRPAKKCVGWEGAVNYVHMSNDLTLLYQLANRSGGLEVVMLHMLLWSERRSLRKDIFNVSKFFKPEGEILWHSAIEYNGRTDIPFLAVNGWMEGEYEKYSDGGCFEMAFSGIAQYLECMNDKGTIRFYDGNPVEMRRKEENNPTIDHADMYLTELRMLNSWHEDGGSETAGAEFAGIVEGCRTETICGEKCYIISLWSGPMSESVSFPWTLLVAANRVEGRYVPRVGDMVHGNAFMFGTFYGEKQDQPTVVHERIVPKGYVKDESTKEQGAGTATDNLHDADGDKSNASSKEPSDDQKDWEWLPRKPATYPKCVHHGGGLHASVKKIHPKFVVYADYIKEMSDELTPVRPPSRMKLRRIIDSIDYVITKQNNLHEFASVFDVIGIRHMVLDRKTGVRHLWCCLPSGVYKEHYRTNLLIALDENDLVLRYSFHAGDWGLSQMTRGMAVSIHFQSSKNLIYYDTIKEAAAHVGEMKKDDYMIAASHGPTTLLQAWCDDVTPDGTQKLLIEWHVHGLPWQFRIKNGTKGQFVAMLDEYDKNGIEAVQTMAKWRWCRMENCNV